MLSVMDIPKGNVKKTWLQSCFILKLFSLNLSFYDCQNVSYTKIRYQGDAPCKEIQKCLLFLNFVNKVWLKARLNTLFYRKEHFVSLKSALLQNFGKLKGVIPSAWTH